MRMPQNIGPFHIVGIGGIGMSAIAETLLGLGYNVQGSDQNDSANVQRLIKKGARILIGHAPENIDGVQFVIISTAVKAGNPEMEAARAQGIPVIRRAEILAEIMRLYSTISVTGTHGKTTTTSMTSSLLEAGGIDPSVITGGIVESWGTNARTGLAEGWMVVEADESDGTFLKLPTTIGIITNLDPEHLDHYGTFTKLKEAFATFFDNIPFYGLAVMCIDHPEVRALYENHREERSKKRVLTYGFADDADLRLSNYASKNGKSTFDVAFSERVPGGVRSLDGLVLPIPGKYNASNALAAMAVALELGLSDDVIRSGLEGFGGVSRRFSFRGDWQGVQIYDDYAHHPVEIESVLGAAKDTAVGKVIAIMQPHRYTRLEDLFEEFGKCCSNADYVAVLPVYEAGEKPIVGINHISLCQKIEENGHKNVTALENQDALTVFLAETASQDDLVICLGAGSISQWAQDLPQRLADISQKMSAG